MELVLRAPRGLSGTTGAVANYYSGHPDDPLAGYCDLLKSYGDIGVSQYGPPGCRDLATCQAGGTPTPAPAFLCQQALRAADGIQWCFDGSKWYPLGAGCAALAHAVSDMSQIPNRITGGCAAGWEMGADGQCHPQGYATPQPVTAAMTAAAQAAGFTTPTPAPASGGGVPTSLIHGGGLTLVPAPASGVPAWVWLAAGAAVLFLVVKR